MRQTTLAIAMSLACWILVAGVESQPTQPEPLLNQPVEYRLMTVPDMNCVAPVWSPNGRLIAFSTLGKIDKGGLSRGRLTLTGGHSSVCVVSADGKDAKAVSAGSFPCWLPDSRQLVYSYLTGFGCTDVYSGASRWIYQPTGNALIADLPTPSPDGRKIAFLLNYRPGLDTPRTIDIVNTDGSGGRALAAVDATTASLSWSPNSQAIAYSIREQHELKEDRAAIGPALWIVPAVGNGKAYHVAYGEAAALWSPRRWWSPDSRLLVVYDAYAGKSAFALVEAHTGARQVLSDEKVYRRNLSWSPDGKWISYVTGATGTSALSVISSDGKRTAQLTRVGGDIQSYDWSPDSRRIAFIRDGEVWVTEVPKGT